MASVAKMLNLQRTQVTTTPKNLLPSEVGVDMLAGSDTVNLPSAALYPGLAIEIFNGSGAEIDVGLQVGTQQILVDGSAFTTVPVSAGASHIYISGGTTIWYEF